MQKIRQASLLLLIAFTAFNGCARITIHPIEGTDIVMTKKGDQLTAPKDGAFLSNEYITEVMNAKLGK